MIKIRKNRTLNMKESILDPRKRIIYNARNPLLEKRHTGEAIM